MKGDSICCRYSFTPLQTIIDEDVLCDVYDVLEALGKCSMHQEKTMVQMPTKTGARYENITTLPTLTQARSKTKGKTLRRKWPNPCR